MIIYKQHQQRQKKNIITPTKKKETIASTRAKTKIKKLLTLNEISKFYGGKIKAGENMANKKKIVKLFRYLCVCVSALVYPFALNDKSKCFKYS